MNYRSKDKINQKIIEGVAASAKVAIEKAKHTGTKLVIWKDGKMALIDPYEL